MSVFDIFARLEREKAQKEAAAVPIEWLVVGLGNPAIMPGSVRWTRIAGIPGSGLTG